MIIHAEFHEDLFGHSSNIKVATPTILEASVLVLLMGVMYEVHRWDRLIWHDIYVARFMMID
jgi:hypothetical protein